MNKNKKTKNQKKNIKNEYTTLKIEGNIRIKNKYERVK
jgi:hypothetical protein